MLKKEFFALISQRPDIRVWAGSESGPEKLLISGRECYTPRRGDHLKKVKDPFWWDDQKSPEAAWVHIKKAGYCYYRLENTAFKVCVSKFNAPQEIDINQLPVAA
jgi:hypothetical protein